LAEAGISNKRQARYQRPAGGGLVMAARADLDRDRQLLEPLDLEHTTEKEEAWMIRTLE